jgi:hypothetical protein
LAVSHASSASRSASRGRLIFHEDIDSHAAALLDVDALLTGPSANCSGVNAAGTPPAATAGRPASIAADLASTGDVSLQGLVELVVVLAAEVNLVVRTVQAESDSTFRRATINVVDE